MTFFSWATEVGICGRIQECHAIWHNKVVILNQGFNASNKVFFWLEGKKSNQNGVLTYCDGALFEWAGAVMLLYNSRYIKRYYVSNMYVYYLLLRFYNINENQYNVAE